MKSLFLYLLVFVSAVSSAFAIKGDNFGEDRLEQEQTRMIKQRMEESPVNPPSSTSIGGARSGQLELEQSRDDQREHEFNKQKQLYESEGTYRRGL